MAVWLNFKSLLCAVRYSISCGFSFDQSMCCERLLSVSLSSQHCYWVISMFVFFRAHLDVGIILIVMDTSACFFTPTSVQMFHLTNITILFILKNRLLSWHKGPKTYRKHFGTKINKTSNIKLLLFWFTFLKRCRTESRSLLFSFSHFAVFNPPSTLPHPTLLVFLWSYISAFLCVWAKLLLWSVLLKQNKHRPPYPPWSYSVGVEEPGMLTWNLDQVLIGSCIVKLTHSHFISQTQSFAFIEQFMDRISHHDSINCYYLQSCCPCPEIQYKFSMSRWLPVNWTGLKIIHTVLLFLFLIFR